MGKNGRLRSCIHYRGVGEPKDSPIGRTTSTRVISRSLEKILKRCVRPYHGNETCHVFTLERWKGIKTFLPKVDERGDIVIPIEFLGSTLKMDFCVKEMWEKVQNSFSPQQRALLWIC